MAAATIVWLGDEASRDSRVVGGKAASLGALVGNFRVPPGFCVTAEALSAAGIAGGRLTPIPFELSQEIDQAYEELCSLCGEADVPVAVRSSAVAEDGRAASFAGLYDTFLNIRGTEAVIQAIVDCSRSASGDRVTSYLRQRAGAAKRSSVAVLVQQLITADTSAVAFTTDPVTGDRSSVIVNATLGLGESLVGGEVTPDMFCVSKSSLMILEREIADKERMTILGPARTEQVDVPRLLRRHPSLDDAQVVEIASVALDLENAVGWPVDIECAYRDGALYLLQCRPITTIRAADFKEARLESEEAGR